MWKYTHYCRKIPKMKINSFQKQTHGYLFIFDQTKLLRITRSMPIYRWRFTYSLFKLKDSIIQFVGNHTPRSEKSAECRVRSIRFLLFEIKRVFVYNSTSFKLTDLFIFYFFIQNVNADKNGYKIMYNGSNCDRKSQLSEKLTEPLNPRA